MTQEAGVEFMDPGFVATDIVDGDVTSAVHVEGVIDVEKQGTQELKYRVSDASGNSSKIVLRTVTVEDTQPPVIQLIGEPSIQVEAGTIYVDAGATAMDIFDGDISLLLDSVSNVRTDLPGLYAVKYNIADNHAANVATEVCPVNRGCRHNRADRHATG